ESFVRIIQAATGGGFGSKLALNVQGFIGLVLNYLKRPVRRVYSREEADLATAKRRPLTIKMKTGVDAEGKLRAMKATITRDTGAYGSYGIAVASRDAVHATGPYEIENVDIISRRVYTNNPFCGAMRGFGTPQIAFAHESQLDLHAKALDLNPLDIRTRRAFDVGFVTSTEQVLSAGVGVRDCLSALKPYYEDAKTKCVREESDPFKRGDVGAMWCGIGNTGTPNPSTAKIAMSPDGNVTL
ncbi:MAG: molybdopterin-dependent oxidoreductase, partial [Desulfobacterales bacterium]|nr:molybdopterin-dependent oxidoreductase [Desulfobacterales bacterium]